MGARWFNITIGGDSPKECGGCGGMQRLVTLNGSENIEAGGSLDIKIPIAYKRYLLNTVEVSNKTNTADILVRIFNFFDGKEVYRSHKENRVYDILNIGVEDETATEDGGNIYIRVENQSNTQITIDYYINILSLQ